MNLRDELEPFASNGREASTLTERWVARIQRTAARRHPFPSDDGAARGAARFDQQNIQSKVNES
jgi:hypothetical protein